MKKLLNIFIILFGFGVAAAPWLAGLWGERTSERIGNTKLTPLPEIKTWQDIFSASLASDFLKGSAERAPLRERLINGRYQFFYDLGLALDPIPVDLGTPLFYLGLDGWIFYIDELTAACGIRDESLPKAFTHAMQKSGKEFYITIVPDKSNLYREFEHPLLQAVDCHDNRLQHAQAITQAMADSGITHNFINLWDILRQAKADESMEIYSPIDTHWNYLGKVHALSAIIKRIQPDIFHPNDIQQHGFKPFRLHSMIKQKYNMPMYMIERSDVISTEPESIGQPPVVLLKYHNKDISPGQTALIKKNTVVIHDSFFDRFYGSDDIAQYFSEIVFIRHDDLGNAIVDSYIKNADLIIWEVVERSVWTRMRQWINLTHRLQS